MPSFAFAKHLNQAGSNDITYSLQKKYSPVVDKALNVFSEDMLSENGVKVRQSGSGNLLLYQLDLASNKDMKALGSMRVPVLDYIAKRDAFWLGKRKGKTIIVGSNGRGVAYGLMTLSRMGGKIDEKYETTQVPTVEFRGISMENVTLTSADYRKLFTLMLRMRANTLCAGWDAGESSLHLTKGLRAGADSFGIDLATPHDGNAIRLHGHKREALTIDVTWHDDGYGYVMPTNGNDDGDDDGGVVYHLSYAGRPHDYLWLSTTQPGLVYNEMLTAYDHGAKRLWMVALHDINVSAYPLRLFMDMAWNVDSVRNAGVKANLESWLKSKFGSRAADDLLQPLMQYYRLVGMRRPEFMDFSMQSAPSKANPNGDGGVKNTEFNAEEFGNELERYINDYRAVCKKIEAFGNTLNGEQKDYFFITIEYPVRSAALMADKMLEAQESRLIGRKPSFHHDDEALESAARSMKAFWAMQALNKQYADAVSKQYWNKPVNLAPRGLAVFGKPVFTDTVSVQEVEKYYNPEPVYAPLSNDECIVYNASDFTTASKGTEKVDLLGHSLKAVQLQKDGSVSYRFYSNIGGGVLRLAFVPTFALNGESSQCSVAIDNGAPTTIIVNDGSASSDRWARGVLRGQTVITLPAALGTGMHTLTIKALNDHIVFDQWMIDRDADRHFYVFPK